MCLDDWQTPTDKHKKILDVVRRFDKHQIEGKSLFFTGPPGFGKSSLALAMRDEAHKTDRLAMYHTIQSIMATMRKLMQSGYSQTPDEYLDRIVNFKGLLILDEIGRSKGENWDKNDILFPLLDQRQDKYNLWISNYSLDQLEKHYDASISSRMQIANVVDFCGLEDWRKKL